jgi:predicted dithiol-disulfide oxidoreductase (DUF899 family)
MVFPERVSREEWLEERLRLLTAEKEETRRRDALNTKRRQLPMVRIEKDYIFGSPGGPVPFAELFGGCRQLIVQHIMFGPGWPAPCPQCQNAVGELSDGLLAHLRGRDTAFALVSRAPLDELEAFRASQGWTVPWYSSHGSDFNYDFQVTLDRDAGQLHYNYRPQPELLGGDQTTEMPGHSCFLREGDDVFHTYSTFGRGNENTPSLYTLLDLTALGRQEAWEEPKDRAPVLH